jgi:ACR3 family arsenite transporter
VKSINISAPTSAARSSAAGMNVFERYLSLWVALCMVAGVLLGKLWPAGISAIRNLEFGKGSQINLPIAFSSG